VVAAIGLVNGLITVKVRIPSFLVTLGTLGIISGIARNMNNLQSMPIRNDAFSALFGAGSLGPISSLVIWTAIAFAIGHFALHQLLFRTRFGLAVRAVSEDPDAALFMGVNTGRVIFLAFILASAIGGVAGYFIMATEEVITPKFGLQATFKGLIAMMLGGMGSVPGAIAGGPRGDERGFDAQSAQQAWNHQGPRAIAGINGHFESGLANGVGIDVVHNLLDVASNHGV